MAGAARETRRVGGTLAYVVNPSLALDAAGQARAAADGLVLGTYDPGTSGSRHDAGDRKPFERLVIVGGDDDATAAAERARTRRRVGESRARPLERAAERA